MKIVNTKKIKLSTGVELWVTEMPNGRVRIYQAPSKKRRKNPYMNETRKVEVSTITPIVVDLIFSGE